MKKVVLVTIVIAILAVLALPTMAATTFEPFISAPIYEVKTSEVEAIGNPQAGFSYLQQDVWQWSASMNEFLKGLPTGIGLMMTAYANVDAGPGCAILGVYASPAELRGSAKITDLVPGHMDLLGRWTTNIPVDRFPGPQCWRFYALIKDGKRKDHTFLVLIHWATKKNKAAFIDRIEYTTARWCGPLPDPLTLTIYMDRAGVGGSSALVYDQMDVADREAEEMRAEQERRAQPKVTTTTTLDYNIQLSIDGQPLSNGVIVINDKVHGDRTIQLDALGMAGMRNAEPGEYHFSTVIDGQTVRGSYVIKSGDKSVEIKLGGGQ